MDSTQRPMVIPDEPVAETNPFIYGHFAEHHGELIYPGIFAGTGSSLSNTGGIRAHSTFDSRTWSRSPRRRRWRRAAGRFACRCPQAASSAS